MTNYREILRLQSLGLNKTEIAASLGCAHILFEEVIILGILSLTSLLKVFSLVFSP